MLTIFEEYPDAVSQKNYSGDLPLHLALRSGAHASIVERMLDMCPEIIYAHDQSGKFPWQMSKVPGFDSEILFRALRAGVLAQDILASTTFLTSDSNTAGGTRSSHEAMISLLDYMHSQGRGAELMQPQLLEHIAKRMESSLHGLAGIVHTNVGVVGHYFAAGSTASSSCAMLRAWHCGEVF